MFRAFGSTAEEDEDGMDHGYVVIGWVEAWDIGLRWSGTASIALPTLDLETPGDTVLRSAATSTGERKKDVTSRSTVRQSSLPSSSLLLQLVARVVAIEMRREGASDIIFSALVGR